MSFGSHQRLRNFVELLEEHTSEGVFRTKIVDRIRNRGRSGLGERGVMQLCQNHREQIQQYMENIWKVLDEGKVPIPPEMLTEKMTEGIVDDRLSEEDAYVRKFQEVTGQTPAPEFRRIFITIFARGARLARQLQEILNYRSDWE